MMNQARAARIRCSPIVDSSAGRGRFRLFDRNTPNDRFVGKLQGRDRVVTAGPRLLPLTARPGQVKGRAARVE